MPSSTAFMARLTAGLIRKYGEAGEHPSYPRAQWHVVDAPIYWEWVVEQLLCKLASALPDA